MSFLPMMCGVRVCVFVCVFVLEESDGGGC